MARALDSIRVLVAQPALNVTILGGYTGLLTGRTGKTHQMFNDIACLRFLPNVTILAPADAHELRAAMIAAAEVLRRGPDATLVSTGVQTTRVLAAANLLAANGIDVTVLHVPTIAPLDGVGIVSSARETGLVITVEEHDVHGGLGGAVAEVLGEHSPTPLVRLGLRGYGESGANEALLSKYGLAPEAVAEDVTAALSSHRSR